MYELVLVDKNGKVSYTYTGEELDTTIEVARDLFERETVKAVFVLEGTLIQSICDGLTVSFHIKYVWGKIKAEVEPPAEVTDIKIVDLPYQDNLFVHGVRDGKDVWLLKDGSWTEIEDHADANIPLIKND